MKLRFTPHPQPLRANRVPPPSDSYTPPAKIIKWCNESKSLSPYLSPKRLSSIPLFISHPQTTMPARLPPPPAVNTPPRTFTERDYGHDVYHGYVNSIRHATTSDLWNGSKAYELGILIGAHLILFNSRDDNWDMSSDGLSHFFRMFYYKRPRHQPRLDRENVNRPAYHFIGKELRTVFPRDPFRDELVSNPLFLSS